MAYTQGNILDTEGGKFAPNTVSDAVYDLNKGQKLTKTLEDTPGRTALGYPKFITATAYAEGEIVYHQNKLWKFKTDHAAGAWNASEVDEYNVKQAFASLQETIDGMMEGEVVPRLSENLESWSEETTPAANSWADTIRTTAGEDPVNTEDGGTLKTISAGAGEDFILDALATTGYNQLRLTSDGGQAKSLASDAARVVPVPHLQLGAFGTAEQNNGMLFTGKPTDYTGGYAFGGSDLQPTVRFVPLSSGEPTSASAGEEVTPTAVTYQNKTYHTYLTSGEGWLIVTPPSGVAWTDICAHIAWEDWYDRFISPADEADGGDSIDLSALATALTSLNGVGKFLFLAEGIFTKAERTDDTHMLITEPVGRVVSPSWTNTLQEDGVTYLHTLTIPTMKAGGKASIEGSSQYIAISGNTLSYADQAEEAVSGAVRYELATAATQSVTLSKTRYSMNDCGVEIKVGAVGSGYATCEYTQNIPDALRMMASVKVSMMMRVIAEAFLAQRAEINALRAVINDPTRTANFFAYRSCGFPMQLSGAGAPNASIVPNEWTDGMGVWTGIPMIPAQEYFDTQNNKWYKAKMRLTGAVSDWLLMN